MMRRGKDADKVVEPMFPRLSVNDTEKGGPRAPPRNKMALYEQLCTPSQRFNAGRFSSSPEQLCTPSQRFNAGRFSSSPGMKPNSITPPVSSNQVGGYGKSLFPSLHVPPSIPTPQSERPENLSSRDMNLNSYPLVDPEQRQNAGDEDDYMVPVYSRSNTSHVHAPNRGNSAAAKSINGPLYAGHPTKNMSSTHINLEQNNSNLPDREYQARMHRIDRVSTGHNRSDPPVTDNEYLGQHVQDRPSVENIDNGDDISETSVVDSMSGLEITPDEVVGIIGYKHFLKARKAINNQQRLFSVQVFELHRLIQVQRIIAGAPELMVDDIAYVGRALKGPPANKVPLPAIKPPRHSVNPKSHSEKLNHDLECTAENVKANGRNGSQMPSYGPFSGSVPPAPTPNDPTTAPWCFPQPSGHQWLVPVMSPSEGLIYKPYPGPGFMSPPGGGFSPMGGMPDPAAPFAQGGFMNTPYGYPTPYFPPFAPHPQGAGIPPGQNYFPPFSMPSANPALSSSAVEQMHQFTGSGVHRHQLQSTTGASNSNQLPNESSYNLQKQSSETVSQVRKIRRPKHNNGLQGSTASSPLERSEQGTELLPTNPTTTTTTKEPPPPPPPPTRTTSNPPKVIKVIPHNARSATESAARIFQSIQRERKHQDQDTV